MISCSNAVRNTSATRAAKEEFVACEKSILTSGSAARNHRHWWHCLHSQPAAENVAKRALRRALQPAALLTRDLLLMAASAGSVACRERAPIVWSPVLSS